jgi:energy-coupling factor transport system permease protein
VRSAVVQAANPFSILFPLLRFAEAGTPQDANRFMIVNFGYHFRNSFVESFDPRSRWFFSLLLLFAIINFWDIRFLFGFLLISLTQFFLAKLTWKETRKAWFFIFFLMTMMILVNTLITGTGTVGEVMDTGIGHPIWEIQKADFLFGWDFKFTLTIERLWFALTQIVRVLAISGLFIVIPFTMDPRQYGATFKGMGLPDKLAFTLDLAFRFVPTLARDFSVTLDAQKARGYELERVDGNIFRQIRKMAPLIVPVTMNSLLSGEDMVNAMDLRCFGIQARTWLEQLHYRRRDYILIASAVLLLVVSFILPKLLHIGNFWLPNWLIP